LQITILVGKTLEHDDSSVDFGDRLIYQQLSTGGLNQAKMGFIQCVHQKYNQLAIPCHSLQFQRCRMA
jgi:hypothetical protein